MRHEKVVHSSKTIVATTTIIADTVAAIAGDTARVISLMGPGVDPHLYRARESDVHTLAQADIIFYHGLHLEGKMAHVFKGMGRFTRSVAVTDVLDVSQLRSADFEDMYDPHVWFDVSLWISVAQGIQDALIEYDPINTDIYKQNGQLYIQRLKELHAYVQEKVATIPQEQRILITAHDAFGYFGQAYGFEVIGLQGLSTDADISTKDISLLSDYSVEKKIKALFVESSIPHRTLQAVQHAVQAKGWQVALGDELYSDSLADAHDVAGSYHGMVMYNVDIITQSLQ